MNPQQHQSVMKKVLLTVVTKLDLGILGNKNWTASLLQLAGTGLVLGREDGQAEGQGALLRPWLHYEVQTQLQSTKA